MNSKNIKYINAAEAFLCSLTANMIRLPFRDLRLFAIQMPTQDLQWSCLNTNFLQFNTLLRTIKHGRHSLQPERRLHRSASHFPRTLVSHVRMGEKMHRIWP